MDPWNVTPLVAKEMFNSDIVVDSVNYKKIG